MKNNREVSYKFLESVTGFGDSILIPITGIKHISVKYTTGWEIHINGGEEFDLVECFGKDDDKLNRRFEQIKKIIEAA